MNKKQYRLPAEFTQKWLAALRSGEYRQGTGQLYSSFDDLNTANYCCLGVAAHLCGVPNDLLVDKDFVYPVEKCKPAIDDDDEWYDQEALNKLSLAQQLNDVYPTELKYDGAVGLSTKLSTMNDGGITFKEIADWIEQNVELYEEPVSIT